jgi:hypothetical protein
MFWTHLTQRYIDSRFSYHSSCLYIRSILSSVLALGCILLLFSFAAAEQLTLAWDDPNHDPSANGGYRLYYWQPYWEMPASVDSGSSGTATFTDATTGAYTYTPPPQTTGTDTFRFQVNGGTVDSNVATMRVTITSALDEVIDTDGDGLPDDVERDVYDTDPLLADTDADGISDGAELETDPDSTTSDPLTP